MNILLKHLLDFVYLTQLGSAILIYSRPLHHYFLIYYIHRTFLLPYIFLRFSYTDLTHLEILYSATSCFLHHIYHFYTLRTYCTNASPASQRFYKKKCAPLFFTTPFYHSCRSSPSLNPQTYPIPLAAL